MPAWALILIGGLIGIVANLIGAGTTRAIRKKWAIKRCKDLYYSLWKEQGEDNADKCKKILAEVRNHNIRPRDIHSGFGAWPDPEGEGMADLAWLFSRCVAMDKQNRDNRTAAERENALNQARSAYASLVDRTNFTRLPRVSLDEINTIVEKYSDNVVPIGYPEISSWDGHDALPADQVKAQAALEALFRVKEVLRIKTAYINLLLNESGRMTSTEINEILENAESALSQINGRIGEIIDEEDLQSILMIAYGFGEQPPKTDAAGASAGFAKKTNEIG